MCSLGLGGFVDSAPARGSSSPSGCSCSGGVLTAGARVTWRSLVGLLLAGWGIFNLVEGVVDHHILTIHILTTRHVRDDVADPIWWDLGFLAFGAGLVIAGFALGRRGGAASREPN